MKNIFYNECLFLLRSRVFLIILSSFFISLIITTYFGNIHSKQIINDQRESKEHIRKQWDDMDPTNPHRAAHFGSYAFKPTNILNSLDEGINSVTGNVLRLEGHTQNDVMFSEASQSLEMSKFGKLKPSLIFQTIIPLFLIFISFSSYTNERDSGRLKLLIVQGASLKNIVFAKIFCSWCIAVLMLLSTISVQFLYSSLDYNIDTIFRLLLFFFSYSMYYFVIICLTVYFSLVFKNSTAALSSMILIWVLWSIFLPKISGNLVEKISPLPSRVSMQKLMDDDRSKGIDGHNPSEERESELLEITLKKYNVKTIEDLPINFSGVIMQADEEYGNLVWDKHFGNLYSKLERQKFYYQVCGLFNPFISVQNLSMGSTGTDMFHHLDFLYQAENYRRFFIKKLNDEYAFGGSKTGDYGWKAEKKFFQSVKDFNYNFPTLKVSLKKYLPDLIIIFVWSALLIFLIIKSSKNTDYI